MDLAPYIPQVEPYTPLLKKVPCATALTLSKFVSLGGQSYDGGIKRARMLRELGASTVVLVGTSVDKRLEAVFKDPLRFVDALTDAGVDIVLGPAFSIYRGRPTIEWLANRSRNLQLYRTLHEAGVQAVPAVGFIDSKHADFVAGWVEDYGLSSVFLDLQSADDDETWHHVCKALPAFISRATVIRRLVINGVAHPARVAELGQLTEPLDLVLTNGNAFQLARSGHDYFLVDGALRKLQTTARATEVFDSLFNFYTEAALRRMEHYVAPPAQLRFRLRHARERRRESGARESTPRQTEFPLDPVD